MNRRIVVISGYFDIAHHGHMEYARLAKEFAGENGKVICIVNADRQAVLKKGFSFVPENDRLAVMTAVRWVDEAILSIDYDRTVCATLAMLCERDEKPTHFLNGGDVTVENKCPEETICNQNGIELVYGFGDKIQSSSWIIEKSVKIAYEKMKSS